MSIIKRISETEYVRSAIADKADLSAFKEKPSLRVILGVSAIGFSYIIGWPAIAALAALAIYLERPWLVAIGGPLLYGFSHLVFLLGMYLAGYQLYKNFYALGNPGCGGKMDEKKFLSLSQPYFWLLWLVVANQLDNIALMTIVDQSHGSQHGCNGQRIKIAGQQCSDAQDKHHHKRSDKGDPNDRKDCQPGQSRNPGSKRRNDRCKSEIIGHPFPPRNW